jgi:hypothetical protein
MIKRGRISNNRRTFKRRGDEIKDCAVPGELDTNEFID